MEYTGERLVMTDRGVEDKNREEHVARYQFAVPLAKNKKVLDIACGTGYGSVMLLLGGARMVMGGDIDAETIEAANKEYKQENLEFQVMNGLAIPAENESFETVVSLETIEHIREAEQFVSELTRVLAAGGKLILSTPNKKATQKLGIKNQYHVRELSQQELELILKDKFKEIKIYGQRPLAKQSLKQKVLKKAYFLYTKIKWLEFLKRWFPAKTRQSIGKEIDGLSDNFAVEEMERGKEYLYLVVVAVKTSPLAPLLGKERGTPPVGSG
jgi:2-polyprenyl-3-methyl-5-hydroxy-6-metoxy-1,4-benzoquinol methylase